MIRTTCRVTFLFCLMSVLAACNALGGGEDGRILLWHSWDETERPALEQVLARFEAVYPADQVISVYMPADELMDRYREASRLGLGPDIFFAPSEWILPLAEEGLIRDVTENLPATEIYLSGTITNVTFENRLFGIPFAVRPVALYYNRNLVEAPAATLDALLQQAVNGTGVGINTEFGTAFWGSQAFGGSLFDSQGRVLLDQGGFANWLNWLKSAQEVGGMFLSRDDATLQDLFLRGSVAYYITGPDFLSVARGRLGEENVGVSPLPSGPNGDAGPLLHTDVLLINDASSDNASRVAMRLAQFLTNAEQSSLFVREISLVPANRQIRIDNRSYPAISAFATQARSSVPIPNIPQMQAVLTQGNSVFVRVLEGILDVNDAALELTSTVNSAYGFEPVETVVATCSQRGTVTIWHSLDMRASAWLSGVATAYTDLCNDVQINLVSFVETDQDLLISFRNSISDPSDPSPPDLILSTSDDLFELASIGLIQSFPNEMLLRFLPVAQEAVRFQGEVLGLPVAIRIPILYYDAEQVSDPVSLLSELLVEAQNGRGVAIPSDFATAYWGIHIFGNDLFDDQTFAPEDSGLSLWLEWLLNADKNNAMILGSDRAELRDMLVRGEVAYYLGWSTDLAVLRSRMGNDRIRVVPLPNGEMGSASPFIIVDVLFQPISSSASQISLARNFAEFITSNGNQEMLASQLNLIPAAVSSNVSAVPIMSALTAQLSLAQVLPNTAEATAARLYGDAMYEDILSGNLSIEEAVARFVEQVSVNAVPTSTGGE